MPGEARHNLMTVRGIACVALVAYHVVGPTQASGMRLPETSYLHVVMSSLDFLRMPMFTVLSGFLYASRRAEPNTLAPFFRRKAARLLIPLLFVTTVVLLLRRQVYQDGTSLVRAFFFSYQHLWYLQALILIFMVMGCWDALKRPGWEELCIVGIAAVMISRTFQVTSFLSINGALYLLPFFVTGIILRTNEQLIATGRLSKLAAATVAIVLTTQFASQYWGDPGISRLSFPATLCGVSGSYLLLTFCKRMNWADHIGRYSYTIFLWHSVTASGARHALRALVALPNIVEFTVLLGVGLLTPIMIHHLVARIPGLSLAAAGIRSDRPPGRWSTEPRNN